jgi:uncharacterized protein (TIGR02145 family)
VKTFCQNILLITVLIITCGILIISCNKSSNTEVPIEENFIENPQIQENPQIDNKEIKYIIVLINYKKCWNGPIDDCDEYKEFTYLSDVVESEYFDEDVKYRLMDHHELIVKRMYPSQQHDPIILLKRDCFIFDTYAEASKYKESVKLDKSKNKQENTKEIIKDGSGNSYNTIKIGNQYWLDQNLKTTKYLDGSNIKLEADYLNWPSLSIGAYSTSNSNFQKETGIIYNWYVIKQSKKVCPAGWHVPHLDEWESLFKHLGGIESAGIKLKETGSTHWSKDNESTNETKFSAKSSSYYGVSGEFVFSCLAGAYLKLWCSNQSDIDEAFTISFSRSEDEVKVHTSDKNSGYAIRCIMD